MLRNQLVAKQLLVLLTKLLYDLPSRTFPCFKIAARDDFVAAGQLLNQARGLGLVELSERVGGDILQG